MTGLTWRAEAERWQQGSDHIQRVLWRWISGSLLFLALCLIFR